MGSEMCILKFLIRRTCLCYTDILIPLVNPKRTFSKRVNVNLDFCINDFEFCINDETYVRMKYFTCPELGLPGLNMKKINKAIKY